MSVHYWRWFGAHLGTILTCCGVLCTVVAAGAVTQYQIGEQGRALDALEAKQIIDREMLIEVRNDVKWIRAALDRWLP